MNDQPSHIKKLTQAAASYSVSPSDKAWDRINKKIKQKKGRKLNTHGIEVHTMVVITLLAISTVIAVYFQIDKRKQNPQVDHQYQQNIKPQNNG